MCFKCVLNGSDTSVSNIMAGVVSRRIHPNWIICCAIHTTTLREFGDADIFRGVNFYVSSLFSVYFSGSIFCREIFAWSYKICAYFIVILFQFRNRKYFHSPNEEVNLVSRQVSLYQVNLHLNYPTSYQVTCIVP